MRALGCSAILLLASCGVDSPHTRIGFEVHLAPCEEETETCTYHLDGPSILVESDDGRRTLYGEAKAPWGGTILLEIISGPSGPQVRYREIEDGAVTFRGTIDNAAIGSMSIGQPWTFRFEASNQLQLAGPKERLISSGEVFTVDPEGVQPVRQGSGRVEVVSDSTVYVNSGGCDPGDPYQHPSPDPSTPISTPTPDPDPFPDPDPDPDPPDPDPYPDPDPTYPNPDPYPDPDPPDDSYSSSGSGCDGDTADDSSSSGCGGCEGDTSSSTDYSSSSSSGCGDSSSSSGCEGDSSSSGADCGGCEGDTVAALPPEERARRAVLSLLRLTWPIALVGWYNRRRRRRSTRWKILDRWAARE